MRKANPDQPTLPGLSPPLPPPLTWHASHEREAEPAAAGLPARDLCRACGVAGDGEAAATFPGDPCCMVTIGRPAAPPGAP